MLIVLFYGLCLRFCVGLMCWFDFILVGCLYFALVVGCFAVCLIAMVCVVWLLVVSFCVCTCFTVAGWFCC